MSGVCHDLNGRASALLGLGELSRLDPVDPYLSDALVQEAESIERAVLALRVMSVRGPLDAEPVAPEDYLPGILDLHGRQPGLEGTQATILPSSGCEPILAPWPLVSRVILLLLAHAAARLIQHGGGRLELSCGRGTSVTIAGHPHPGPAAADPAAEELVRDFGGRPSADIEAAVAGIGGELSIDPNEEAGPRYEVRLPALPPRPGQT